MPDLDYQYGGQWFNDMGSLAFSFPDDPATGIDIARAGLTRDQANSMASALMKIGISGYETPGMVDLGV